eukprot:Gb_15715 [translate_table: standard]
MPSDSDSHLRVSFPSFLAWYATIVWGMGPKRTVVHVFSPSFLSLIHCLVLTNNFSALFPFYLVSAYHWFDPQPQQLEFGRTIDLAKGDGVHISLVCHSLPNLITSSLRISHLDVFIVNDLLDYLEVRQQNLLHLKNFRRGRANVVAESFKVPHFLLLGTVDAIGIRQQLKYLTVVK